MREDCELGFGPLKLRKGDNNKQHFRLKQNSQISTLDLKKKNQIYAMYIWQKKKAFAGLQKPLKLNPMFFEVLMHFFISLS